MQMLRGSAISFMVSFQLRAFAHIKVIWKECENKKKSVHGAQRATRNQNNGAKRLALPAVDCMLKLSRAKSTRPQSIRQNIFRCRTRCPRTPNAPNLTERLRPSEAASWNMQTEWSPTPSTLCTGFAGSYKSSSCVRTRRMCRQC
jgi:hypothetical protein